MKHSQNQEKNCYHVSSLTVKSNKDTLSRMIRMFMIPSIPDSIDHFIWAARQLSAIDRVKDVPLDKIGWFAIVVTSRWNHLQNWNIDSFKVKPTAGTITWPEFSYMKQSMEILWSFPHMTRLVTNAPWRKERIPESWYWLILWYEAAVGYSGLMA